MTFKKDKYPPNWTELRAAVLERAENRCECRGECGHPHRAGGEGLPEGRCSAPHGQTIFRERANLPVWYDEDNAPFVWLEIDLKRLKCVLTTAHLDHDTTHNGLENLRAFCQYCHFAYDARDNRVRRTTARAARLSAGTPPLRFR